MSISIERASTWRAFAGLESGHLADNGKALSQKRDQAVIVSVDLATVVDESLSRFGLTGFFGARLEASCSAGQSPRLKKLNRIARRVFDQHLGAAGATDGLAALAGLDGAERSEGDAEIGNLNHQAAPAAGLGL